MKEHFDLEWQRIQEIKKEKIEECLKDPTLIGDMFDDIEILKLEGQRKDYQFKKATEDLKRLNNRIIILEDQIKRGGLETTKE